MERGDIFKLVSIRSTTYSNGFHPEPLGLGTEYNEKVYVVMKKR